MDQLSNDERLEIIKHPIRIAGGKVPVIAVGNFGNTIQEQAGFIHKVNDNGVKTVSIVTGMIARENESDDVFDNRMYELFNLTDTIPLGFYECPKPCFSDIKGYTIVVFGVTICCYLCTAGQP